MLVLARRTRLRAGSLLVVAATVMAMMVSTLPALALDGHSGVDEHSEPTTQGVDQGESAIGTDGSPTGTADAEGAALPEGSGSAESTITSRDELPDAGVSTDSAVSSPPAVALSKSAGLTDGETITVTGTGFSPVSPATNGTRPPLAGQFGGVFVIFGSFAETWRPSEGAPSSARVVAPGQTRWVVNPANVAPLGGSPAGAVAISPDGSFEVQLTVTDEFTGMLEQGRLGVFTFAGSGAVYAPFETETLVTFAAPVNSSLTVVAVPSAIEAGESTTLRATVVPAAAGTVEFFDGATSLGTATVDPSTGVATLSYAAAPQGERVVRAVFTPTDSGASTAAEASTTLTVRAPAVTLPSSAGSLRWSIKQSFSSYVTGPIAQGSISVTGAANDGAVVVFPQTSPAGSTGVITYGGAVRYVGHSGALDVTIASPTIRFVSSSQADLIATVNGTRVTLARLALATGARSVLPDGAIRYAGVSATLTAAGAPVFSFGGTQFYPAGTALDPVTFTVGAPSTASAPNRIVGAFVGPQIPTSPPATTGAEIVGADAGALQPGQSITLTASGFDAGESDIAVVAYSEPIVLSESVSADAQGVATWTGTLPADLIGVHTLTMQGSVDRGVVVTILQFAQSVALPDACVIENAELVWGFKEAFRAYISGAIANGEWELLEGAEYETPTFTFAGSGALDSNSGAGEILFTGGIRFTGHGGILDTSVSNPRVIVLDSDSAQLVLDVVGTTQEGAAIEAAGVVFADLDLGAASRSADNGMLAIAGAPATLTATGAEAFGTYPAGEQLDPVSITGTLADNCGAVGTVEPVTEVATGDEQVPWWWWVVVPALFAAVAAIVVVFVRRRARA